MCFLCRRIWLHLTSRLLYQLWIELRLSIGIFRSWFSHWRSFHQAGLLNACWVPWDTWSVFKGSSWTTRKEKQKQLCTEALLLWRDLTESSAELAWHPGCLGLCPCRYLCDALSGLSCSERQLMPPGHSGHELYLTLLRPKPGKPLEDSQQPPAPHFS